LQKQQQAQQNILYKFVKTSSVCAFQRQQSTTTTLSR